MYYFFKSEFGSDIYNNLLKSSCKLLLCDQYYGQLCITQNQKLCTEFGSEFYNNLFRNFEI
jgi:hypothetical protein